MTEPHMMTLERDPQVSVISVVQVVFLRGNGDTVPVRRVTQYWDFDGRMLAEDDPESGRCVRRGVPEP